MLGQRIVNTLMRTREVDSPLARLDIVKHAFGKFAPCTVVLHMR